MQNITKQLKSIIWSSTGVVSRGNPLRARIWGKDQRVTERLRATETLKKRVLRSGGLFARQTVEHPECLLDESCIHVHKHSANTLTDLLLDPKFDGLSCKRFGVQKPADLSGALVPPAWVWLLFSLAPAALWRLQELWNWTITADYWRHCLLLIYYQVIHQWLSCLCAGSPERS